MRSSSPLFLEDAPASLEDELPMVSQCQNVVRLWKGESIGAGRCARVRFVVPAESPFDATQPTAAPV